MDFPRLSSKQYAINLALVFGGGAALSLFALPSHPAYDPLVGIVGLPGLGCFCFGTIRLVARRAIMPLAVLMLLSPFLAAFSVSKQYAPPPFVKSYYKHTQDPSEVDRFDPDRE